MTAGPAAVTVRITRDAAKGMTARDPHGKPFSFGAVPGAASPRRRSVPGWVKLTLAASVVSAAAIGYLYFVDPGLGRELLGDPPIAPPPAVTTAYKWRDERGNWQLTDRPPPEGTPYETIEASSDANIMPSLKSGQD